MEQLPLSSLSTSSASCAGHREGRHKQPEWKANNSTAPPHLPRSMEQPLQAWQREGSSLAAACDCRPTHVAACQRQRHHSSLQCNVPVCECAEAAVLTIPRKCEATQLSLLPLPKAPQ
eukprot:1162051-Pelagomonas_calceolata.AAC.22